jgi:hypothetical protein
MQDYNSHFIPSIYFECSYLAMTLTLLVSVSPAGIAVTVRYFLFITGKFIQNKNATLIKSQVVYVQMQLIYMIQ